MLAAIDPWRLAKNAQLVTGEFPLVELPRLGAALYGPASGKVSFAWQFGIDDAGRAFVSGRTVTEVTLQCQRCLRPLPWPLIAHTLAGLLHPGEAEDDLPEDWEALVVPQVPIGLLQLVEDELLLMLPIAPMHEVCPPHEYIISEAAAAVQSPFAALAELKQNRGC